VPAGWKAPCSEARAVGAALAPDSCDAGHVSDARSCASVHALTYVGDGRAPLEGAEHAEGAGVLVHLVESTRHKRGN
jgi:hypothetical protein